MKNIKIGILFGILAGVIDVVPMIIQKLSWDANLSAFIFWVVSGFIVSISNLNLKGALKGLVLSLALLAPLAIIIGWSKPLSLIPILTMNIILGLFLGYFIDKYTKK
jgi:hypothetical protein